MQKGQSSWVHVWQVEAAEGMKVRRIEEAASGNREEE